MPTPVTVVCIFRVQDGNEAEFTDLLRRHWPTLRDLELATNKPPQHFQGNEQSGGPIFFEIFEWADEDGADLAHQHPKVMAIWEPMGRLVEKRDGRPGMEFPHVQPVHLHA